MLLESPAGFCVHGWDHWHFEQSQGDDFCKCSFAKEQTTGEGSMISVFKELMSWLGRKGMIRTKSLKILDSVSSHAWHRPPGPRRMCDSYQQGLGSHLGHWGWSWAMFSGVLVHVLSFLHIFYVLYSVLVSTELSAPVTYRRRDLPIYLSNGWQVSIGDSMRVYYMELRRK